MPIAFKEYQANPRFEPTLKDILSVDNAIILFCSLDCLMTNVAMAYINSDTQNKDQLIDLFKKQIIRFMGFKTEEAVLMSNIRESDRAVMPTLSNRLPSICSGSSSPSSSFSFLSVKSKSSFKVGVPTQQDLRKKIETDMREVKKHDIYFNKLEPKLRPMALHILAGINENSNSLADNCKKLKSANTFLEVESYISTIITECEKQRVNEFAKLAELDVAKTTSKNLAQPFWLGINAILSYLRVVAIQLKISLQTKFVDPEMERINSGLQQKIDLISSVIQYVDDNHLQDKADYIFKSITYSAYLQENSWFKEISSLVLECKVRHQAHTKFLELAKKERENQIQMEAEAGKAKEELAEKVFKELLMQAKVELEKKRLAHQEKLKKLRENLKNKDDLPPILYADDQVEEVSNDNNIPVQSSIHPAGVRELELARNTFETKIEKDEARQKYEAIMKNNAFNPIVRANAALGVVAIHIYRSKYTADSTEIRFDYLNKGIKLLKSEFAKFANLPASDKASDEVNDLMFYFEEYSLKIRKAMDNFQKPVQNFQRKIEDIQKKLQTYSEQRDIVKPIKGPQMLVLFLMPTYTFKYHEEKDKRDEALKWLRKRGGKYSYQGKMYDLSTVEDSQLAELGWRVPRSHKNYWEGLQEALQGKVKVYSELERQVNELEKISKETHQNIILQQMHQVTEQNKLKEVSALLVDVPQEFNRSMLTDVNELKLAASSCSSTTSSKPEEFTYTVGEAMTNLSGPNHRFNSISPQHEAIQQNQEEVVTLLKADVYSKEFAKGYNSEREAHSAPNANSDELREAFVKGQAAANKPTERSSDPKIQTAFQQEKEAEELKKDIGLNFDRPDIKRLLKAIGEDAYSQSCTASVANPLSARENLPTPTASSHYEQAALTPMQQFEAYEKQFNRIYDEVMAVKDNSEEFVAKYKSYKLVLKDIPDKARAILTLFSSQDEQDSLYSRWEQMQLGLAAIQCNCSSWMDEEIINFGQPLWPEEDIKDIKDMQSKTTLIDKKKELPLVTNMSIASVNKAQDPLPTRNDNDQQSLGKIKLKKISTDKKKNSLSSIDTLNKKHQTTILSLEDEFKELVKSFNENYYSWIEEFKKKGFITASVSRFDEMKKICEKVEVIFHESEAKGDLYSQKEKMMRRLNKLEGEFSRECGLYNEAAIMIKRSENSKAKRHDDSSININIMPNLNQPQSFAAMVNKQQEESQPASVVKISMFPPAPKQPMKMPKSKSNLKGKGRR